MEEKNLFCSLVGVPNVGKSTLLNNLIGFDLAIISPKAETTRTRITGVLTDNDGIQYVFLDTPGFHKPKNKLDVKLIKSVRDTYLDVDCALFVTVPKTSFSEDEMRLLKELKQRDIPIILGINKIDTIRLLETEDKYKELLSGLFDFDGVACFSAIDGKGIDDLKKTLSAYATIGPHYFPDDTLTDIPEKYVVAEIIREKLLYNLRDELPHGCATEVMSFKEREDVSIIDIDANIYCERESHKGMIIGKQGKMLKKIATESRIKIEEFLDSKVNLQCWVKVRPDWRDKEYDLKDLGF